MKNSFKKMFSFFFMETNKVICYRDIDSHYDHLQMIFFLIMLISSSNVTTHLNIYMGDVSGFINITIITPHEKVSYW